jgi:hypothetical protein
MHTPPRVMILSQMPRDRQTPMDTCEDHHQSSTDAKDEHQNVIDKTSNHQAGTDAKIHYQSGTDGKNHSCDGHYRDKSTITGMLCKRVLAYVKWCQGCYPEVDTSVMNSSGHWLCNRGISVYIDPV